MTRLKGNNLRRKLFHFKLVYREPLLPSFWSQLRIAVFTRIIVMWFVYRMIMSWVLLDILGYSICWLTKCHVLAVATQCMQSVPPLPGVLNLYPLPLPFQARGGVNQWYLNPELKKESKLHTLVHVWILLPMWSCITTELLLTLWDIRLRARFMQFPVVNWTKTAETLRWDDKLSSSKRAWK